MITVAALPGRGGYVRHLAHPEGIDGIHRITVPASGPGALTPPRFEPGWLGGNLGGVDLVDVHGLPAGGDAGRALACLDAVRAAGRPLVFTGYHLSDPTGRDQAGFAEQLDVLVPAADATVALTGSAAAEMRRRWGVEALLVPHPHVVDFVRMRQPRPARTRDELVVGLHLGSLQGGYDPVAFTRTLAEAVRQVPGGRLLVTVNEPVLDPQSTCYQPAAVDAVEAAARAARGAVRARRPFTDSQLWDYLVALDACVLPAAPGSHSVWPEACFDLGTSVLVPAGTHAREQVPSLSYACTDAGPDAASLADALGRARSGGPAPRATPSQRWAQRVAIGESLRGLYERLLGMGG